MESDEPDSDKNHFPSLSRLPILDISEHISRNLPAEHMWTLITVC